MYRYESWTIKKAEHQRIDAFKLWCWRRLLRVSWTARRSNQSILKEINLEYSLEGLMLKLKLQYFGHLMERTTLWRRPWCWERLKAGGKGVDRGWDGCMVSPSGWTWVWVSSGSWWWTGKPGMLQSRGHKELDMTEWLDWTEPTDGCEMWNHSGSQGEELGVFWEETIIGSHSEDVVASIWVALMAETVPEAFGMGEASMLAQW